MFVKVPHGIFSYGLSSNALKVYLYLSASCGGRDSVSVRYATISDRCHISTNTAVSAVKALENCGLLKLENRYLDGQYISNRYSLTRIIGKWFALDLASNPFALPPAAFGVYLCLCRCKNRKGKAFPSYTHMAKMLGGRAKATISSGLKMLEEIGLIKRMARWAGKHNLYILGTKKQQTLSYPCACCSQSTGSFSATQYTNSVSFYMHFVNSFFCRGSSIFDKHGIDPPS